MKALQVASVPVTKAQQTQTLPLQAGTLPASTTTTSDLDISALMNLMITMMIVVMMMKMMSGMMAGIT